MTRISEIQERAGKATDGPWFRMSSREGQPIVLAGGGRRVAETPQDGDGRGTQDELNAAFIAHARADIPWLLDEIERLRTENDELAAAYKHKNKMAVDLFKRAEAAERVVKAAHLQWECFGVCGELKEALQDHNEFLLDKETGNG